MGMSKLAAARRKQQRTPVCERAAVTAAGPMCSDTQQQIGAEPLLQEALPLADVRRIAGAGARRREEGLCPRRSSRRWRNSAAAAAESSCETISQRWLLCLVSLPPSLYFSPAPPAPLPAHTEAEPALYHHRGSPPARAAPGGTASTAPRSLGATSENGSSQRHRGARWWLCRRTFRLMTCTDRMSVARRWGGAVLCPLGQ